MLDPTEFGKAMASIVRDQLAPLQKRIDALESRAIEKGDKGDQGLQGDKGLQGDRGNDGDKGDRGDEGKKGDAGKDADPIDLRDVSLELAACPEIKTVIDLLVADAVAAHFASNPVKNGADGKAGDRGDKGDPGLKGDAGKDGRGTAGAILDRDGILILTMTDGTTEKLGHVVGKDGINGKDGDHGKDGLSVESLEREYDADAHEVVERWTVAGKTKELRYPAGGIRDGGYWTQGKRALACQTMTHDGTLWIALRDTSAKPCLENKDDWRIAARKGRDGIDGAKGRDLGPPVPVKLDKTNA